MHLIASTASLLAFVSSAFGGPLIKREAVPSYVVDYAPMVYLYSTDPYRPADIISQLGHTHPEVNFTAVSGAPAALTLDNLSELNNFGDVYLTSNDNVETNPDWLYGVTPNDDHKTDGAVSCAIIVNDHGAGQVDVFYMYFYAFGTFYIEHFRLSTLEAMGGRFSGYFGGDFFGLKALGFDGFNIGDHVGDWEHNMIRFQDGKPQAIWYSQHANGEAFKYSVVEKYTGNVDRPVVYSANGSHANYAIRGDHDHAIPNINLPQGLIEDHTDAGLVWDPTLSAYYVKYDAASSTFTAYNENTPTDWLKFTGHWGDQQYPKSDSRQETILGIDGTQKYTGGPTGPEDKQLNRMKVCPDNGNDCILRSILVP
ncbi:hypothetical protein LTR56_001848 [Elasticomyces elasticus]|nr:hypothetical protein LTR56_001848 [Elasticomyces elasticus]KAK4909025.1 hypothetical protein LTR49_022179 [Elasticomyces elasticus]